MLSSDSWLAYHDINLDKGENSPKYFKNDIAYTYYSWEWVDWPTMGGRATWLIDRLTDNTRI